MDGQAQATTTQAPTRPASPGSADDWRIPGTWRSGHEATRSHARPTADSARPGAEPSGSTATSLLAKFPPSFRRNFRLHLIAGDALAVLVGAAVAFAIWSSVRVISDELIGEHALLFAVSFPIWIGALMVSRLYLARVVASQAEEFRRIWVACGASVVSMVVLGFALQYDNLSRIWIGLLVVSIGTALVVERAIARRVFDWLRRTGRLSRRIAVIGNDDHAARLIELFRHDPTHGYSVAGFIGDHTANHAPDDCLGSIDDAEELLRRNGCTGAIVSLSAVGADEVNQLVRHLTDSGFHIALSSSLQDIDIRRVRPQSIDGYSMMYIEPVIRDGWRARAKRLFDFALATVASILSAPVVLAAAVAIKLDSSGPVFFRQERVGQDGEPFQILKLRTMVVDAEAKLDDVLDQNEREGALFKSSSDPRITRVGRFLRQWSIDEIPQFYNVILGDMSVVGPRPALPREVDLWDEQTAERLRALPGITGLWQVEGRGNESFDVYKRLDLAYVDNWSLLHDLRIVWKTFGAVVARRGAI